MRVGIVSPTMLGWDTLAIPLREQLVPIAAPRAATPWSPVSQTTLVSSDASGVQGLGDSWFPALSADGRTVVFGSAAANLAPSQGSGGFQVYSKDLKTGAVTCASSNARGVPGNGDSGFPALSADGRIVAFDSLASNLVPGGGANLSQVFVKDLLSGSILCASADVDGAQGNGDSNSPALSADGRFVAFWSKADNLVDHATQGFQVYVKDLHNGAVICASTNAEGEPGNGASGFPSLSADGRYVAFDSLASNLVPGASAAFIQVYVKDLRTGAIIRVSSDADGEPGDGASGSPALAADGRSVAFVSTAHNLLPGGTFGFADQVYVRDLETGTMKCASCDAHGLRGNGISARPTLSADGRFVAFETYAANLAPHSPRGGVFVKDIKTGALACISTDTRGEQANGISGDFGVALSADGRTVVFESKASNLVTSATKGYGEVFVAPNKLKA